MKQSRSLKRVDFWNGGLAMISLDQLPAGVSPKFRINFLHPRLFPLRLILLF